MLNANLDRFCVLPAKDHGGKVPYIEGRDYPEPYGSGLLRVHSLGF